MELAARRVERTLVGLGDARIDQRSAFLVKEVFQDSCDGTLAKARMQIQLPDDLATELEEVIAMPPQGRAGERLFEQLREENFEDVEQTLTGKQITGSDPPGVRPVIDVEIVRLKR